MILVVTLTPVAAVVAICSVQSISASALDHVCVWPDGILNRRSGQSSNSLKKGRKMLTMNNYSLNLRYYVRNDGIF